jgi:hypothetical protein
VRLPLRLLHAGGAGRGRKGCAERCGTDRNCAAGGRRSASQRCA